MRAYVHAPRAKKTKPEEAPVAKPLHHKLKGAFANLIPELQRAVEMQGYSAPTPIQDQCIPHILDKKDILGVAQTGTGKTAAFALPTLQLLAGNKKNTGKGRPRVLILAPTRELAAQIGDSIHTYGRYLSLKHTVVFGGVSQYNQVKSLNRGVDVLVATPGRLLDLVRQRKIHLDCVEMFILDEVDRMLDMGFIPDITEVLEMIPKDRQTLFFSATMNRKMAAIAGKMVTDPVRVDIEPDKHTLDNVSQKVMFVAKKDKNALLYSLLSDGKIGKAIIFTQMKHTANVVSEYLYGIGIKSSAIHGDKTQAARTKALSLFKTGRIKVLIATDVAARGIDVSDITHVINYDLPVEAETYIHRIGRTGRAGASGDAISFCSEDDRAYLSAVERVIEKSVPVDKDHEFHCDKAMKSKKAAPRNFGRRGGGGRSGGGRGDSRGGRGGSSGARRGGSSRSAKGGFARQSKRHHRGGK